MVQEWECGLMENLTKKQQGEKKMEQLMKILEEARPDVDFQNEINLIDGEVLDSMDIISIIMEINNVFEIELDPEDLEAKNFNSVGAIWALIQEYQMK